MSESLFSKRDFEYINRQSLYINKETPTQVISCEFCKIFKKTFLTDHQATASLFDELCLIKLAIKIFLVHVTIACYQKYLERCDLHKPLNSIFLSRATLVNHFFSFSIKLKWLWILLKLVKKYLFKYNRVFCRLWTSIWPLGSFFLFFVTIHELFLVVQLCFSIISDDVVKY